MNSKHWSGLFVGVVAVWALVRFTPIHDALPLTGLLNDAVPERSDPEPVDPTRGYYLQDLGGGAWYITGWSHNTMFVVTDESVVVLDAPPSLGEAYRDAIAQVTDKPVSHLIYSHHHADHIGAADLFPEATVVAHHITAEVLAEKRDPARRVPDVTFEDRHTLEVGGTRLELAYHGPAHGPGNIAVHLPEQRVLAMIDVAFPKWVPIHEFAIAEDIDAYYAVYDDLLAYEFDHFVGGHANLGDRQDVQDALDYALDVQEHSRQAVGAAAIRDIGAMMEWSPNAYATANFGFERMTAQCTSAVEETWADRLGGVDVFTHSHCRRMVFQAMTE